jgi:hypothetical protein
MPSPSRGPYRASRCLTAVGMNSRLRRLEAEMRSKVIDKVNRSPLIRFPRTHRVKNERSEVGVWILPGLYR